MVNGFGNYFPTKYFGAHLDLEDLINLYNQKKNQFRSVKEAKDTTQSVHEKHYMTLRQ